MTPDEVWLLHEVWETSCDEFEKVTYALKTVEDAERLRRQILRCFEEAHTTTDPVRSVQ